MSEPSQIALLRRALVEAAVPLEGMRLSATFDSFPDLWKREIDSAIAEIRSALEATK